MASTGGPYGPGGPDGPPDGGGPGGPGGPGDEPPFGEPDERPWYRQPGPLAALIAGVAALVLGLIALLVIRSDDDDNDGDNTLPSISTTTISPTTIPATTAAPTTVPATTTTSTTVPETTSTSTTTTTTTATTTTTTTTTIPPTTTSTTSTTTTTTVAPTTTTAPPGPTAWDVLQDQPELTEFVAAIGADSNLVDLVDGPEPVTILAPQDDFVEPDQLTGEQIRRQLIGQSLTEAQLFELDSVQTLSGATLAVETDVDPPTVGDVTILEPDVEASNGFIQLVNGITTPAG